MVKYVQKKKENKIKTTKRKEKKKTFPSTEVEPRTINVLRNETKC